MSLARVVRPARFALAALLAAGAADAHMGHPELRGERFLGLALAGGASGALPAGTPGLSYVLALGPTAAAAERRRADADGDGRVSAREGNAALDRLTSEMLAHLTICSGRTLDRVACHAPEARDLVRSTATGWAGADASPLSLAWIVALRLDGDDAAVRVDDAWDRPEVEATNVAIAGPLGHPLLRAGAAEAPGVTTELTWVENVRAGRPRSVVAAWKPGAPRVAGAALVAVGAAAILATLARLRRVRARDAGQPKP